MGINYKSRHQRKGQTWNSKMWVYLLTLRGPWKNILEESAFVKTNFILQQKEVEIFRIFDDFKAVIGKLLDWSWKSHDTIDKKKVQDELKRRKWAELSLSTFSSFWAWIQCGQGFQFCHKVFAMLCQNKPLFL